MAFSDKPGARDALLLLLADTDLRHRRLKNEVETSVQRLISIAAAHPNLAVSDRISDVATDLIMAVKSSEDFLPETTS